VVHGSGGRAGRGRRAQAGLTPIGAHVRALAAIGAALLVGLLVIGCAGPAPSSSSAAAETVRRFRVTSAVRPLTAQDVTALAQDAQLAMDAAGVTGATATATNDGLEIHLAGTDAQADDIVRRLLLAEGSMRLLDPGDTMPEDGTKVDPAWPVLMDGSKVDGTTVHLERDDQGLRVVFSVRPEAANAFSTWTNEHLGQSFVIALDDRVLSAPMIQSTIRLEDMAITTPSDEDTVRLAAALRAAGGVTLVPLAG